MRAKRIASLGMALLLVTATPVAVYASTDSKVDISSGTHVIEGNIDYSGDDNALHVEGNGTDVTVKGDVISGGTGVESDGIADVTVNGNIESKGIGIDADGNTNVGVKGNVTGKNGTVIDASGSSTVNVSGNVKADKVQGDKPGIKATGVSSITIEGDVSSVTDDRDTDYNRSSFETVNAGDGSKIDIKGSLKIESGKGIVAGGSNTQVTVGKDITISGASGSASWAADAKNGAVIKVGNINTDASGVAAATGGTVIVEGDVENASGDNNRSISLSGDNSTILIGNDIRSKDKDNGEIRISISGAGSSSELAVGGKIDNTGGLKMKVDIDDNGKLKNLPEIVVGEITDPSKIEMIGSVDGMSERPVTDDVKKEVLDNIKYIVNTNPDSMEGKGAFTITKLNGDSLSRDKSDKYDVTTKTEQILVRISVSDGYEVDSFSAGKNNTYVRNADGSYTVTVADGGGINIEALIKAIERDPDPVKPIPIDSGSGSGSSSGNSNRGGSTLTNGTWNGTGANMTFTKADGSLVRNEWADINVNGKVNRYHFDANGMITKGWYTDNSGIKYYFNEILGSDYGVMCTGWKLIDGKWYYFMPYTIIRNGVSFNAGSMLHDTVTPDGYKVGFDGAWIE